MLQVPICFILPLNFTWSEGNDEKCVSHPLCMVLLTRTLEYFSNAANGLVRPNSRIYLDFNTSEV
uniref:AlNc14C1G71 protein n=1 Tax=Albugo laibachii Nc14 TaxID=890382 RepID=F0VYS0_9STRA|nr:AlNc14C1G71 [Albugo laibachii Nc14]|eukprot:CCA13934.1 AlNc14C1G71 [Albugo laibachii Nc14]